MMKEIPLPTQQGLTTINIKKGECILNPATNPPRMIYGPCIVNVKVYPDGINMTVSH